MYLSFNAIKYPENWRSVLILLLYVSILTLNLKFDENSIFIQKDCSALQICFLRKLLSISSINFFCFNCTIKFKLLQQLYI